MKHHPHASPQRAPEEKVPSGLVLDPVCNMQIDPSQAAASMDYQEVTWHFCSHSCHEKFRADPAKYTQAPAPAPMAPPVSEGALYTCPMHPEVVQEGPGSCPICGMALEPKVVTAEAGPDPELGDMSRRMWWGAALTTPLFFLAMGDMLGLPGLGSLFGATGQAWLEFGLSAPVVLWAGWPFFQRMAASFAHRSPNMFTLVGIGVGTAFGYSVLATALPDLIPASFRGHDGLPARYFEAASVITVLVLLGQVLELRARARTSGAIRALLGLAPKTARRVGADQTEVDIPLEEVQVGDLLRVRPGEKVPVDGTVTQGRSHVDESMISGESEPVAKGPGEPITGATINTTGSLLMRAERVGASTVLARIVQMVGQAQRSRAPVQRIVDRVSAWFVLSVLGTAALTFVLWAALGPEPRLAHAMVAAVAVLIIACPCALGLATPMSIMVGVGKGALMGVLVRDAEALELLERVDTLVVDKTGTLTEGKPRVVSELLVSGVTQADLLRAAGSLEQGSEHPLASAVVRAAQDAGLRLDPPQHFESITGKGVMGQVGGQAVLIGTEELLAEHGVETSALAEEVAKHRAGGETVVWVARAGALLGALGIADPVRATTPEALRLLRESGVRILMATGDNPVTAEAIARQLGITQWQAQVSPAMKVDVVARLQAAGRVVAMAGDGINDAPALARADVGIAMGSGTDVAMESARVTLVRGDLRAIARARGLSRATMRNIRQNLVFAFGYNALGVPLAAGVLYAPFGLLLSPIVAAAAMSLSSVSVIANALRLRGARV